MIKQLFDTLQNRTVPHCALCCAGVNWMKHLQKLGVDYWLVGATDRKTAEFLAGQVCGEGNSVTL